MWTLFRTSLPKLSELAIPKHSKSIKASLATLSSVSLLIGGSIIANDQSTNSLDGVSVDSSIDPFPTKISGAANHLFSTDYTLIASGVRSVTFLGFKVYGVGLYIPRKSESTVVSVVAEFLKTHPGQTPQSILDDKAVSQDLVAELSEKVPYAMKITPVRNTDFGHLRDGLTKSILANPMAKRMREEVSSGVEQLREVFQGFRGSVPKNDTLWVVSDTKSTTIAHETTAANTFKTLGVVTEPVIAKVLLVSYLSSVKPLSEPLRKNFVGYVENMG
ncbi:hypothetical protein JCM33374_g2984 [Metschnikowia sp. JCM 33374]|nr:hypothetical protein JCM33374_g2984 [Metschnikowia sp. JCM 33374]